MPRQLLGVCTCCLALLLIGGCGGDASSGGGDEGTGASGGLGGGIERPDIFLPPNHRAPLICSDGTLLVLPEGECVWGVCADEVSGLAARTGTCTPTGVGYLSLSCEDCVGYYENPSFNEGMEEAYLLTNFPIDSVVAPLTIGRNCTDTGCPQVDHEGVTRFRVEFDLTVSCESDPDIPCAGE